ncbi:uncharacterized protein cubi_00757 [Cryptosporidium ubiquitum]|uniref:Uncharacterized protein n=1 Tax=Cryptosporidium ubiquitum TaxID=857276 RepID=A0A1J4MD11_9CRYT|nr:uncharacterized protein cubi_00757 [Cryptosporidium ubiquitum]OII71379.1 hypothetical protein cubi_00757 [Cryptosporidium ubiquitum]
MTDFSKFQGLNSSQIHEELLKCPKSSWPKIISELPTGIKSELVAILSNKRTNFTQNNNTLGNEDTKENTPKKSKVEVSKQDSQISSSPIENKNQTQNLNEIAIVHPRCVSLETETNMETNTGLESLNQDQICSLSMSSHLNKVFQELMISTFSPINTVISRTMYIAGDVRPFLKNKDCKEKSVRLIQSYLNIWISLFWKSLINKSNKKKISNKLTNNIIKKHFSEYYKQEVSKFDYDTLINKSAHRQVGMNTNSENGIIQTTDPDITSISSSVKEEDVINDLDENEGIDYNHNIPSHMMISIDKRFEDRLKLRDTRTKNMSPEVYKEFAMLREKNFRPSINTLQEWLSITWNTTYNNGLKDTKVSQIPSNSLQLFSFILNDIISSLVENALRISYLENCNLKNSGSKTIMEDSDYSFENCKDLVNEVNKHKEFIFGSINDEFNLQKVDFNVIIDTFSKNQDEIPRLNYIHYILAITQRLNEVDFKLLGHSEYQKSNSTVFQIGMDVIIEKLFTLYSKLTGQILRGQQNSVGGSTTGIGGKRKRDGSELLIDLEKCTNNSNLNGDDENEYIGNEEDDMFEAIVESATNEFSITNAFPNGIPDEISIYCYLRMKKVIKESKDPEDFSGLVKEWNKDTTDLDDEESIEIQKTKESCKYCKIQLNKYMNVAYKIIAVSNLIKNFIK